MNSSVQKTKYLTEAAAAAAIAALLVLLKLVAPFFVFITMLTSAVPIAVICSFHGMKWGLGTSLQYIDQQGKGVAVLLNCGETGEQLLVDTSSRGLRERFAAISARREQALRKALAHAGVDGFDREGLLLQARIGRGQDGQESHRA